MNTTSASAVRPTTATNESVNPAELVETPVELSIRGLTKSFPNQAGQVLPVLRGIDLDVPRGSLAAVLGPSGCGKTTLLRVVAGFECAEAGTVTLAGVTVLGPEGDLAPERRRVGYVPQEGALFPHLDVAGNIGFGLPRAQRKSTRVRDLLDMVGLGGFGHRMPHQLSGGQQQRVALARALAPSPALVLLDEPFSALDTSLRAAVRADVRQALSDAGATAVLVTHDQEEALSMADLVAVMREGRIAQVATPSDLYTTPAALEVATFIGDSVVLPIHAEGSIVRSPLGPLTLFSSDASGAGHVVIRPEQIVLNGPGDGVPARVLGSTFFGHDAMLELVTRDGVTVNARCLGAAADLAVGDDVTLAVVGPVSFFPHA